MIWLYRFKKDPCKTSSNIEYIVLLVEASSLQTIEPQQFEQPESLLAIVERRSASRTTGWIRGIAGQQFSARSQNHFLPRFGL